MMDVIAAIFTVFILVVVERYSFVAISFDFSAHVARESIVL